MTNITATGQDKPELLTVLLLLLVAIFCAVPEDLRAAEPEVLLPGEFDIWNGLKNRIYLNGMWQLARVKQGEMTMAEAKGKPLAWWLDYLERKNQQFPVPWDWNTGTATPKVQVELCGNRPSPVVFGRYKDDRALKVTIAGVYCRTFTLKRKTPENHVLLHFEWIDSESEIYVNHKLAGKHKNYYNQSQGNDLHCTEFFDVDISQVVNAGENVLLVKAFDDGMPGSKWRGPD